VKGVRWVSLTDLQIKQGILDKDTNVYEYLVKTYSRQLYYIAYSILHITCGKEDMEECVSDVFLMAWKDIHKYDSARGSFKTWLFILTKYQALKYKRKAERNRKINLKSIANYEHKPMENEVFEKLEQERVMEVIQKLPELDKDLLLCKYYFSEDLDSLMETTNLSSSAIYRRLQRAKHKISEVLSNE